MAPHPSQPRTRLYVTEPLSQGAFLTLDEKRAHYLLHVLRLSVGHKVALFNGCDGEWLGEIRASTKKSVSLEIMQSLRPQKNAPDLWLMFAPLKSGKSEWVVEKATELGVARFCPVVTRYTVAGRINESRLQTIATEAAEQCERLDIPVLDGLVPLTQRLDHWEPDRLLVFGDESGASANVSALLPQLDGQKLALLVGPEGGFSSTELELLRSLPYVRGMCMGPRILRADTAALAALTLLASRSDDWNEKPAFRQMKDA